jgi:hypothetical protein
MNTFRQHIPAFVDCGEERPPPIPKMPCFKCGILTNETQSIFGIGHYQCFMKNKINPKS